MLFRNDIDLHFNAFDDFIRHHAIPVIESFRTQFLQQGTISFNASRIRRRILGFGIITELKVHAATSKQGLGSLNDFRVIDKAVSPLLIGHKTFVLIRLVFFFQLRQQAIVVNGSQQAMRVKIRLRLKDHRLQSDQFSTRNLLIC